MGLDRRLGAGPGVASLHPPLIPLSLLHAVLSQRHGLDVPHHVAQQVVLPVHGETAAGFAYAGKVLSLPGEHLKVPQGQAEIDPPPPR